MQGWLIYKQILTVRSMSEEQNPQLNCSNLMLLNTGDTAAAVRRWAVGLLLHLGGALSVEVDGAALVALDSHKACVQVRDIDGRTEGQGQ